MEPSRGRRGTSGASHFQVIGRSPMPRSIDELVSEAMQLPPEDQTRIARALLAGLQGGGPAAAAPSGESPGATRLTYHIETEQEPDGRWLGEIAELPGVLTYGETPTDTMARVQALALRVLADRIDHGETPSELLDVAFRTA